MTSLYDLNKDELIKLITTIQYITRKDCEKQCEDKIRKILFEMDSEELYTVFQCDYDGCDNYDVKGEYGTVLYGNSEIRTCYDCYTHYCDEHRQNFTNITSEPLCNKCVAELEN